ncbi:hypothetical protein [Arthrobacter sp. efr-133-R2A-120]|uniref:hypothetical protein n=2 Tax=unclassified Arthrobacter TaxID=235627 RepID=UPI00254BDDCE|nr:hypothetical protein [Arthrobacter sp. efr-133-R2A-120]
MNIKRILACLAMAALLAASKAIRAMADVDANAGDAQARVENAPKEAAKAEAVARKVFESDDPPAQLGTLASGGWNTSSWVIGTNAFGGWLYKLTVSGGWCGNGSSATRSWFNSTWGETFAIGWRDNGQVSSHAIISGGSGDDQSCSPW